MTLSEKIAEAEKNKPRFGEPCNHCGWCCMTEVCPSGLYAGARRYEFPCKFLTEENKCGLIENIDLTDQHFLIEFLAIGEGCDSMTQREIIRSKKL